MPSQEIYTLNHSLESLQQRWHKQIPQLLQEFRGLVVACSGGVDSTVLFHLLWHFKQNHRDFPLALTHINYRLRGAASDEAEAHVLNLARRANVPLFAHRVPRSLSSPPPRNHIQSWARTIRYQQFAQLAHEGWLVVIAHHRDDAAENTLLRLARGSSPASMLGMKERYRYFWRPLLSVDKQAILAWSQAQQITFCEDDSNNSLAYSRNVIRHQVLPLLEQLYPGASARIVRCAEQAREFVEASDPLFQQWIAMSRSEGVPCAVFRSLPEGLACHLLSSIIGLAPEGRKRLSHKLLHHLYTRLCQNPAPEFTEQLPANMGKIRIKAERLTLCPAPPPTLSTSRTPAEKQSSPNEISLPQ
jgi:tRNA(Ile)-lysidine synthase